MWVKESVCIHTFDQHIAASVRFSDRQREELVSNGLSDKPWTRHLRCGHSEEAELQIWCRPCGLRCGAQADGLYLSCHSLTTEKPPDHDPAAGLRLAA